MIAQIELSPYKFISKTSLRVTLTCQKGKSAHRSRHYLIGYMLLAAFLLAPVGALADTDYCAIAKMALQAATRIRGLSIKHDVPCLVHDKEEVKHFLVDSIATKLPKGKLASEATIFKAIGMIPDRFDYEHGIVDMYLSQIGGYYDPEKAHFVMAKWMPAMLQATVAVHELTHGLQDQHFNLKTFMDDKIGNNDVLMSRSALVEGDASAVMLDYNRELMGQKLLSDEDNVDSFMLQNIVSLQLMGGSLGVPESLQMMMIFPYNSGLRFVQYLLKKGGYKEVDKVFSRPARSTEEILHPEKYMAQQADFREPEVEEARSRIIPAEAKPVYSDTMGEFSISALLGMYVKDKKESTQAAAGWGGDKIAIFEKDGKRWVSWATLWDTERDADEFYKAFGESIKKRWPELNLDAAGSGRLINGKEIFLKKDGSKVIYSVEAG